QLSVLPRGRLPEVFSLVGPGKQVRLALQRPEETVPTIPTLTHSDWWGRVRNPVDRKHLAGYQIWLIPTGAADSLQAGIPRRTETDADGDFWIPSLIHTDYQVYVLAPGDGGSLEPNLLVPLGASPPLLDHGSGATPAEWVLQSGQLFGEVRSEGRPVRSAMVMLEALVDSNAETGLSRVLPAVQTDAEGRWLVPDLPPATYRVRVRGGGIAQEKQIEVRANQRLRVQF
ncbi:MAG TPA: carboxypeptidase-like regulatory domain-containing protein, partial [Planctomycetota bacterium]|nr:carboxypeptidase-like regulatory domain-containing protein [Planctomycetota bacterium]